MILATRTLASGGGPLGAGFIAFMVFFALCVAVFFLGRSLFKHLRKVPASFDDVQQEPKNVHK